MLNVVRKHADSWMIKFILISIVMAFVGTIFYSWGMGGASGPKGSIVATVDGEKITSSEYDRAFNNLVNVYREQFRNQFSEEMIRRLDLKGSALEALVQRKLLLKVADQMKMQVSDREVAEQIKSFPAFKKDDRFNTTYYKNFLRTRRLTALEFENSQRESLLIDKVQDHIRTNVKVSPFEIQETFNEEEEKAKMEYVVFPANFFKSPDEVTEEEKKQYFEKNKGQFKVPENIQVEYVKVTAKSFEDEIQPTDEDIEEYYQMKKVDYHLKKRFRAHHILHKFEPLVAEPDVSKEDKDKKQKELEEEAREKAEETLKKLKEGAKFDELAKEVSEDPGSASQGGDLGQFTKGTMVPEFEKALGSMKPGELSDPVKTPFGYHIIRLDEIKEERTKTLDEVKPQVVAALKTLRAKQRMRRTVKQIKKAAASEGFAKAVSSKNQETKTTEYFSTEDRNLPDIGIAPEFYSTAYRLTDDQISDPVLTDSAGFLLRVVGRKEAYIPELKDVEEKVAEEAKKDKDRKYTEKKLKEFAKALKKSKDLKKIADEQGVDIKTTPLFSKADSIPGVGNLKEIKDKVFELKVGETGQASVRRKHYLFKVTERVKAGEITPERSREIYDRLKAQKADRFFQSWYEQLKAKSEIKVDQEYLGRTLAS